MAILKVRVIPRSSKREIIKEEHRFKIKLVSPPHDGKANKELKELLSKRLKVPKRAIEIVSGEHSRDKDISIEGLSLKDIQKMLC